MRVLLIGLSLVGCGTDEHVDRRSSSSCQIEQLEDAVEITCDGQTTVVENGQDGSDGRDGRDGVDGKDGVDGEQGIQGVAGINGLDGVDGLNGVDGLDGSFDGTLEYVTVCPEYEGRFKEVFISLNGQFLAFLDGGINDRLVLLEEDVRYQTTDGRKVIFTIESNQIICH